MNARVQGFLQAVGIAAYCFAVGLFMNRISGIIPSPDPVWAPIPFLMIFSASALICTLIVFYKPYKLFFQGKKSQAIEVVVYTAISLIIIALLTLIGLVTLQ